MINYAATKRNSKLWTTSLFTLGLILGIYVFKTHQGYNIYKVGLLEIGSILFFPVMNELGQYLGFLTIGGLRLNEVKFQFADNGKELYITNLLPDGRNKLMQILISPMIINASVALYLSMTSSNGFYSVILSFALGVSGNDIAKAYSISRAPKGSTMLIDDDSRIYSI